jgi:hypothetical protein
VLPERHPLAGQASVALAWRAIGASPWARSFTEVVIGARDHGKLLSLADSG